MKFNSVKEARDWLESAEIPVANGMTDPVTFFDTENMLPSEVWAIFRAYIESILHEASRYDWDCLVTASSEMVRSMLVEEQSMGETNAGNENAVRVENHGDGNVYVYNMSARLRNIYTLYVVMATVWEEKYGPMGHTDEITMYNIRSLYRDYIRLCPQSAAVVAIHTSGPLGRTRILIDGSDDGLLALLLNYTNMLVDQNRGNIQRGIYAHTMLQMLFEAMNRADKNLNLKYGEDIQALCPERELKENQGEYNLYNLNVLNNLDERKRLLDECLQSMMEIVSISEFNAERVEEHSMTAHMAICQNDGTVLHVNSVTKGNVADHLQLVAYTLRALIIRSEYIAEQQSKAPLLDYFSVGRWLYNKTVTGEPTAES